MVLNTAILLQGAQNGFYKSSSGGIGDAVWA